MNPTVLESTLAALAAYQGLQQLRQARSGNPYHDSEGKFASGGSGHGKHHAKRVRRRKKRLEQLRREGHAEIADWRKHHAKQKRELINDQRKDWRQQKAEHKRERQSLLKDQRRESARLVKDNPSKSEIRDQRNEHKRERNELKAQQADERASRKEDYRTDRESQRDLHHEERRELIDRLKSDLHDEVPGRSKSGRQRSLSEPREGVIGDGHDGSRSQGSLRADVSGVRGHVSRVAPKAATRTNGNGRFGASKVSKASSAEAILSYCLRRRGWTAKWKAGELTGRQHLQLLEDIRQYGRRWLRHEAEGLFRHYGNQHLRAYGANGLEQEQPDSNGAGFFSSSRHDDGGIRQERSGEMRSLAGELVSAIGRFFRRVKSFIHELIMSGGMALKGNEPLSATEVEELDRSAKVQSDFLDRFEQEVLVNPPKELPQDAFATVTQIVEGPPMTGPQFVARAEQYANSAWQSSQRANRQSVVSTGVMKLERRVLGHPKTEHCYDCPPLAAMGWQPLGTLPAIGDSECAWLCLCHFEYQDGPEGKPHVTTTKPTERPKRKILLKSTPNTKYKKIQRPPTKEEIDAEVKKWLKGEPNNLTITPPGAPPVVLGTVNPREGGEWKNEAGQPQPGFQLPPQSSPASPTGYTYEEAP